MKTDLAPAPVKGPYPFFIVLNNTVGALSVIGLFSGGIKLAAANGLSAALPSILLVSASTVAGLFTCLNAACWRRQRAVVQSTAARPVIDIHVGGAAASVPGAKGSRLSLYT